MYLLKKPGSTGECNQVQLLLQMQGLLRLRFFVRTEQGFFFTIARVGANNEIENIILINDYFFPVHGDTNQGIRILYERELTPASFKENPSQFINSILLHIIKLIQGELVFHNLKRAERNLTFTDTKPEV